MSNKTLWDSVGTTDPKYTKKVSQRGGFTAIDATYQAKKATEAFGPYGKDWGLSQIDYSYEMLEATGLVICKAVFFYVLDGKRSEFPIHNSVVAVTKGAGGKPDRADSDFCKKLETNTVSKALAKLGFCADVFMGLFEDANYMAEASTRADIDRADKRDAVISEKQQEIIDYISKNVEGIKHAPSNYAAKGIHAVAAKHLERQSKIAEVYDVAFNGFNKLNETLEAREGK
jgi:hypothetical protein